MTPEPRRLDKADIVELDDQVIGRTGNSPGLRDDGLLESAPARPLNRRNSEGITDAHDLAATYAIGRTKNHAFIEGNKRAAVLGMGVSLELNGRTLTASDEDAIPTFFVPRGRRDGPIHPRRPGSRQQRGDLTRQSLGVAPSNGLYATTDFERP